MENPLIAELFADLAFSAKQGPNYAVITTQEKLRAALAELELLRATPGGATEIHVLSNGSHVTGERAANLLDDERDSHGRTIKDLNEAELQLRVALRERADALSKIADLERELVAVKSQSTPPPSVSSPAGAEARGNDLRDWKLFHNIEKDLDNVAAFCVRMARALGKDHVLSKAAMEYLTEHDLIGSPLRVTPAPAPAVDGTHAQGTENVRVRSRPCSFCNVGMVCWRRPDCCGNDIIKPSAQGTEERKS